MNNNNKYELPEGTKAVLEAVVAELREKDPEGHRRRVEEYKKYLNR